MLFHLFGRGVPESVSGLVWIGFLMSVAVVTAQVNVQFDGEMLAQESSRSTRQSWPPWRRRSPADRPESSSSRPLYLADPRPSGQRRRIPPPPVLSHLTAPHAGRLPSLRFSPSRERQQYQWYPRPPPGALPSSSAPAEAPDVQNWRGPDRSASERSQPGGIRRADGPAGLQHQQAFPPERPAAGSQLGTDLRMRPAPSPTRRQEPQSGRRRCVRQPLRTPANTVV
ncbi:serine/arginine repetitive matrix protein 1-like [Amphibalanus amphitrite]|uniref:serine/arginine repetitive matrix protein 1-like n=1 Tax=Amphibalanus amphitrite TaxID=1232801 RepID=UPI001C906115|nr:serine/arginine repetitive matrix protein 1-like [Amphibalanus amphitrite]